MSKPNQLHLILLAGGTGSRASGGRGAPPKQFSTTRVGPLFAVSLREFLRLPESSGFHLAGVTMTVADAWCENAVQGLKDLLPPDSTVPWQTADAGVTRTASTWNALQVLGTGYDGGASGPAPAAAELVAIHDAARPFASFGLLARVANAALAAGGAVPGIKVPDTIVRVAEADEAAGALPPAIYLKRELLYAVQTPQVFRWDILQAAHSIAAAGGMDFTDDGGLLASRGHSPAVVDGEQGNWKVTTEADLRRALDLLK